MDKKPPEIVESDFDYYLARYAEYNGLTDEDFKGKPNLFLNALMDVGEHIFPSLSGNAEETRSEHDLRMAFRWYADRCQRYELTPTMANYAVLIRVDTFSVKRWMSGARRSNDYHQKCMLEFASYCETAMSNATLAEDVPIVSGIFHLKAVHGWSDQPEQKPIEVVHTVSALTDIASRYNIDFKEPEGLPEKEDNK